ncbi:MAG: hypothetical protein CVU39_18270 [Chloroflexi bacterium HGW-Chloroflexi-10]|nr:MAG: hypothetical protein CVU39_18270 [Chloroflexi bacterium HGW-Chloroflexi-10]
MSFLDYLPVLLAAIAAIALFSLKNGRWNILALSLQYVAVFWLVLGVWPVGLAAAKLVSGWMAGVILGGAIPEESVLQINQQDQKETRFRVVLGLMIVLVSFVIAPGIATTIPGPVDILIGGTVLIGIGLLQLGMTADPLRIIFGLLTVLSGFEVFYAAIENSLIVVGLLSMITLGIAFIGSFISNKHQEETIL